MSTYIPGVKYYSVIVNPSQVMYYAQHPDGRIQMTVNTGAWITTQRIPDNAIRCSRKEAVDMNGNHETWFTADEPARTTSY